MHKTLQVRIGLLSKIPQITEEGIFMVTSLDKAKASVTIGEAIGYGNTAEWYREFL